MCGIAGIIDFSGNKSKEWMGLSVQLICSNQAHRGPDASGLWTSPEGQCVLGHRRLAVIDLDERSNQPMLAEDGRYAISFNGEIYNYKPLRRELEACGRRFRTTSDTEVLLNGYAQWGGKLFARLDGMFSLAIYDTLKRELILARDRMGEKPLYYGRASGTLAFASELKALIRVEGISTAVTERGLFDYLTLRYIPDPYTIFEEVLSVQPGTLLRFDHNGRSHEISYYAFEIDEPYKGNIEDYVDKVEDALNYSVRTRLAADVPVGALLSSGVDSSLVCALAAHASNQSVQCFGAGFVDAAEDETLGARAIANHLGLPFEALQISAGDLLQKTQGFGKLLDEPNGDRSCLPTYLLSGLIRSHVKVAVSGDGGDELFVGYGRYQALARNSEFQNMSSTAQAENYFNNGLPVFDRRVLEIAMPEQVREFKKRFLSRFYALFTRSELDTYARLRLTDIYSYLPGAVLAKVDRMSMKHALEVRTPFFSPDLLVMSSMLPKELAQARGLMKLALRKILGKYLPAHLILPVKRGFGMPADVFSKNSALFDDLANQSDEILRNWSPLRDRPTSYASLRMGARANVNSLWAWITLGQWVESLPTSSGSKLI